jgi:polyferredoxin
MVAAVDVEKAVRKKVQNRAPKDYSQRLRRSIQFAFLALNLWIGIQFYLWVRYFETGGQSGAYVDRPAGVEGWLPIASLMNLKAFLLTGEMPAIHPAGTVLLVVFLAASLIFRKAFCGWLCPVGTVSEQLWLLGRKLFRRNWQLPGWADIPLRGLKYLLLGLFLYAVGSMSAEGIRYFLDSPYGIVADVKMLNFFRELSGFGLGVTLFLIVASVFVQNFWCRYLCPYGALMGLVSMASPLRIRRDPVTCVDCAKCAKACPSLLPVDKLITIQSAECLGCLQCVSVCPEDGALMLATPAAAPGRRNPVAPWKVAVGLAILFFGAYLTARITGHWDTNLPDRVYHQLVPRAHEFGHP